MPDELEELKELLKETERELGLDERELWEAFQAFVRLMMSEGMSRERALAIARDVLRKASDLKARKRPSFRIIRG